MSTQDIWLKIKALEGKTITTVRGEKFRITSVSDDRVYYDPVRTQRPRSHWNYISIIAQIVRAIQNSTDKPRQVQDIDGVCQELGIKGQEQTYSYIFAILCAVNVLQHATAGELSDR
jgi:hypothetical protein